MIRLDPNNLDAYNARACAYESTRQWEKAIADYDVVVQMAPSEAQHYYDRSRASCSLGFSALQRAALDIDEFIRREPKSSSGWAARGGIRRSGGDLKGAVEDFSKEIELDPKNPGAWYSRADAQSELEKFSDAVNDYSEAIRLDPKLTVAFRGRADAWRKMGKDEKAIADLETAVGLDARDWRSHLAIARLLAASRHRGIRDVKRAIAHATRACELAGWADEESISALAAAYEESGDRKSAVAVRQRAAARPSWSWGEKPGWGDSRLGHDARGTPVPGTGGEIGPAGRQSGQ